MKCNSGDDFVHDTVPLFLTGMFGLDSKEFKPGGGV
jgi:hypothetical protein